jgi:hypothetical protein
VGRKKNKREEKDEEKDAAGLTLLTHRRFSHFGRACAWAGLGHSWTTGQLFFLVSFVKIDLRF